jgi:hypothetical protein
LFPDACKWILTPETQKPEDRKGRGMPTFALFSWKLAPKLVPSQSDGIGKKARNKKIILHVN